MKNEEALSVLDADLNGLSQSEIHARMQRHGPNQLEQPEPTSALLRFLSQYNDPLNYLLIGAALVALAIKPDHPGDAIFIFLVLTANAFFGFWQEGQAEQAMDALKQMSVSNSITLRDGFESEIPTTDLVPGDIVKLEEGVNVPADLRLLEVYQCRVDESALTGESEPITKHVDPMDVNALLADRRNMMYMGTTVSSGRAVGLVVETGMKTQLGRIASDISDGTKTRIPRKIPRFHSPYCGCLVGIDQTRPCLGRVGTVARCCNYAIHYCDCDFRSDCARRIADYSCYYIGFRHAEHGKAQGHYSQNESS